MLALFEFVCNISKSSSQISQYGQFNYRLYLLLGTLFL